MGRGKMTQQLFADNPAYLAYEKGLKQLHQLIAADKGDTDEADVLRDEMDQPYRDLSSEERARLSGTSADLYMLSGDEIYEPSDMTQEELRQTIKDEWTRRNWDRVLGLLRKGPGFLTQDQIASQRACAYRALGHLDTALLFQKHAAELNPQEVGHKLILLHSLSRMNRSEEAERLAEALLNDPDSPAYVLVSSAYVLFRGTEQMLDETARRLRENIITVLQRAWEGAAPSAQLPPTMVALGYVILGRCYTTLGRLQDGLQAYTAALSYDPNNQAIKRERDLLRETAASLFEFSELPLPDKEAYELIAA